MLYYDLKKKIERPSASGSFSAEPLTENILALNEIAVFLTASNSKIVHCTRSIRTFLGITAREVMAAGWSGMFNRIHADDQKLLKKRLHPELRRYLRRLNSPDREKCSFNYTFRIRNQENEYILVALENRPVHWNKGASPALYMSVLKNISIYGNKNTIVLNVNKKSADCGWEKLFEKEYPLQARGFTARETQIMHLIADGLSSCEIAGKLFISAETVRCHRKRLMVKSGCRSSAELVDFALRHEIV